MNALLSARIAAGVAELSRVVDVPMEPFGFGSDLSCSTDLDPRVELSGDDPRVVLEAVARSLQCPTGGLVDDRAYGYDIVGALNRGLTADLIREIGGRVKVQVLADDRVGTCGVVVRPTPTGSAITIEIRGTLADSSRTSFALVLAAGTSAVLLQEMRTA